MTHSPKQTSWAAVAQVALAAAIWGAAYPLTKGALTLVSPIMLGFCRFLLAGVLLMIVTRSWPLSGVAPEKRVAVFWLSVWGSFVLVVSLNLGLKWAPAGISSVISGTPPIFTVLFAWLWLNEPINIRKIVALIIAFVGIILLTGDVSLSEASLRTVAGVALVTLTQISWAIYSVLGKKLLATYHWTLICRDTFCVGAALLFPFALLEIAISGVGTWNASSLGVLAYLGLANSIVTYGLWNRALTVIPVSQASLILYLQPVTGVLLSFFLFGEQPGMLGWAGMLLVFAGVWLVLGDSPDVTKGPGLEYP